MELLVDAVETEDGSIDAVEAEDGSSGMEHESAGPDSVDNVVERKPEEFGGEMEVADAVTSAATET